SSQPESAERADELEVAGSVVVVQVVERSAQVVVLCLESSDPGQTAVEALCVGELCKREVIVSVAAVHGVGLPLLLQHLVGELADRLEHPEALAGPPQQALVDQRLQAGDVG